jgi:putative tricarboxylic transport membrane protein
MLSWLTDIGGGIAQVFHLGVFIAALGGVTIGVVIGVIPGLGPAIAIALAIPLTYEMGAVVAIALMLGIYKGGTYGGSISAILINTPGTPAAAATVLDGYPLARQGKSGKALNVALAASVVGDFIGIMILCVIAQPMAAIALKFGPTELFALLVFAMTIIAGLSGQSLLKGLIAAVLGIAASTVGIDPLVGMPRFTFDRIFLDDGLPIIPMVIGLFAVTEVLRQAEQVADRSSGALLPPASRSDDARMTRQEFRQCLPVMAQSSLIGTGIGALPGTGSTTGAYLAYGLARSRSRAPQAYGKGSVEGLAAAESGNNAVVGGALIPMLTLGVPGDVVTAILMGAMTLHGIHVGPLIFEQNRVFVFGIFGMLLVSVVMMFFVGKAAIAGCRQLASMPQSIVMPIVMLLCVIGAYSTSYALSDVWMMLAFGVAGYALLKLDIPLPPFIIAFVLSPQLEQSLRQALLLSRGSAMVFVTSPISLGFLVLAAIFVVQIVRRARRPR